MILILAKCICVAKHVAIILAMYILKTTKVELEKCFVVFVNFLYTAKVFLTILQMPIYTERVVFILVKGKTANIFFLNQARVGLREPGFLN